MTKRVNYNFEYVFKANAELLYNYLSTPYNLTVWLADDVKVDGEYLTLVWNGSGEKLKIDKRVFKKKVAYKWIEREENETLSFEIEADDVTGGTMLIISDYDDEDQVEEAHMWWDNAIQNLKRVIGG